MTCRDFLRFFRVKIIQIGLGQLGRAFFGDRPLHHCHRIFGNDADRRIHRIDLALAKLTVDGDHFGLKGHQHIAGVALQKDAGRVTSALAQHWYIFVKLANKLGCLRIGAAFFLDVAPSTQIGITAVAAGFRIDHHHLDARLDQVVPVLDVFRVAIAHQKQHG